MAIRTALTERLGLEYPIVLAPMGNVSGGRLAAAVSNAGGLGLVGGGYGDPDWMRRELSVARTEAARPWGVGLITWHATAETVEFALRYEPHAFMLSFGDPRPYVPAIKAAGCALFCQVQSVEDARAAKAAGADVIIAQGTEAGGHGARRATLPLVPAVVDAVAPTPVLAAGGIVDGRGLAAALMLGAQGSWWARVSTRLRSPWAIHGRRNVSWRPGAATPGERGSSMWCASTGGRNATPGAPSATLSWSAGRAAKTIWTPHWVPKHQPLRPQRGEEISTPRWSGRGRE